MKNYPTKTKKAFMPRFNSEGVVNFQPDYQAKKDLSASDLRGRKFYENEDGTTNATAIDEFEKKREAARFSSKSF